MGTVTPAWFDGLGVIIIYYRSTCQSDSSLSLIYIHVLWIALMSQKWVINWIINWCFINSISTYCGPNMSAHGEILLWLADSLGPIISELLSRTLMATERVCVSASFSKSTNDLGAVSFHLPHRYNLVCFNSLQTRTVLSPQTWSGSFTLPSLTCSASFSNRKASLNLRYLEAARSLILTAINLRPCYQSTQCSMSVSEGKW